MLAAPMPGNNDHMMHEAVTAASKRGLLQPHDHVVCVMSIKDSLVVKVVTMDDVGTRTMRHTNSAAGMVAVPTLLLQVMLQYSTMSYLSVHSLLSLC